MNLISKIVSLIFVLSISTSGIDSSLTATSNMDFESVMSSIYIGESFESGRVYLEMFEEQSMDQEVFKYSDEVSFVGLNDFEIYRGSFDREIISYIGQVEETTRYFFKPFSQPEKRVGLFNCSGDNVISQIGIGVSKYRIESIDRSRNGLLREYSEEEYAQAEEALEYNASIEEEDRILEPMTIENTIAGAKEHFRIRLEGSEVEIVLSEYFAIGFEYAGEVYVIDVVSNGEKLGTLAKFNVDGPY